MDILIWIIISAANWGLGYWAGRNDGRKQITK